VRGVFTSLILLLATSCGSSHSSPSFLVGWYSSEALSPDRLTAYAHDGVNLMLPYRSGEPYTGRWVQAAEKQGISLLLQPDWRWVAHGDMGALASFVRRYHQSSALYGWYLYDEPDVNGLTPERLRAAYRLIKSLDSHPVAVVFSTGHCRFGAGAIDPDYLAGFDLLLFDYYPFYAGIPAGVSWRAAEQDNTACVQSAQKDGKQGPILVLQAFGAGWKDGPLRWRDPTSGETSCLFALAAASGAKGVLFWSDQHADAAVLRNTSRVIAAWHDSGASRVDAACSAQPVPTITNS
jgi:hypothetical protein